MSKSQTEAELAAHYNETEDLTEFDQENPEPVTVKRNVTISVRFSEEEIAELRSRAAKADVKVTSFIRAAALDAANPIDRTELNKLARQLESHAHHVAEVAQGK